MTDDLTGEKLIPPEEQLRLAARLDFRRAIELLGEQNIRVRIDRNFGREISQYFHFSKEQLFDYIRARSGLAAWLLQQSYDQRITAAPYMMEVAGGYEVGQFSKEAGRSDRRRHVSIDDAATDFVLLQWRLPRYVGSSLAEPDEPIRKSE